MEKNKNIKITNRIHEIILGLSIGNNLIFDKRSNTRIIIEGKDTNLNYLMWLWKEFNTAGLVKNEIRLKPFGKEKTYLYTIKTLTFVDLNEYHSRFTLKGGRVKIIPKDLDSDFTSLSLAVWFLDGGTITKTGFKLGTNPFIKEWEIEYLSNMLKNKFDLNSSFTKKNINIKSDSKQKFIDLISPH